MKITLNFMYSKKCISMKNRKSIRSDPLKIVNTTGIEWPMRIIMGNSMKNMNFYSKFLLFLSEIFLCNFPSIGGDVPCVTHGRGRDVPCGRDYLLHSYGNKQPPLRCQWVKWVQWMAIEYFWWVSACSTGEKKKRSEKKSSDPEMSSRALFLVCMAAIMVASVPIPVGNCA